VVRKKGLDKMVKALKLVNELDESFVEVVLLKNAGGQLQPDYRCFDLAIDPKNPEGMAVLQTYLKLSSQAEMKAFFEKNTLCPAEKNAIARLKEVKELYIMCGNHRFAACRELCRQVRAANGNVIYNWQHRRGKLYSSDELPNLRYSVHSRAKQNNDKDNNTVPQTTSEALQSARLFLSSQAAEMMREDPSLTGKSLKELKEKHELWGRKIPFGDGSKMVTLKFWLNITEFNDVEGNDNSANSNDNMFQLICEPDPVFAKIIQVMETMQEAIENLKNATSESKQKKIKVANADAVVKTTRYFLFVLFSCKLTVMFLLCFTLDSLGCKGGTTT